jgi:hypothetical protein
MRCDLCDSETPPHYQHGLMAWICHTCKALGRVIEGALCPDSVEPEMPALEITQNDEAVPSPAQNTIPATSPATTKKKTGFAYSWNEKSE